jgi:hypothetical protein
MLGFGVGTFSETGIDDTIGDEIESVVVVAMAEAEPRTRVTGAGTEDVGTTVAGRSFGSGPGQVMDL